MRRLCGDLVLCFGMWARASALSTQAPTLGLASPMMDFIFINLWPTYLVCKVKKRKEELHKEESGPQRFPLMRFFRPLVGLTLLTITGPLLSSQISLKDLDPVVRLVSEILRGPGLHKEKGRSKGRKREEEVHGG